MHGNIIFKLLFAIRISKKKFLLHRQQSVKKHNVTHRLLLSYQFCTNLYL